MEKELLCKCIENYIDIANKNNNQLDDYISIISFIETLKKQYQNYSNDFNKYINEFKNKGIYNVYISDNKNVVKECLLKYEGNLDIAEDVINGFVDGVSSKFFNYLIAIGICGNLLILKVQDTF